MRIEWIEKDLNEAERLICNDAVDDGLKLLHDLLYAEPGYGSLHNHLGWAYLYYTHDTKRAERHLKLAIRFDPGFAPPFQHLGDLYIRVGRYQDAVDILLQGLPVAGANRLAIIEYLAQAYELKRDYRRAIATYREALASSVGQNANTYSQSIWRCRKKKWAMVL